jgi:VanZ family protein
MQGVIKLTCLIYLVVLTVLLLEADPFWWVPTHSGIPSFIGWAMPAAHLLSFWVLGVLMMTPRWGIPRWSVVLLLIGYAGATEVAQRFFPPRTPEWKDWFQDLAGIAVGMVSYWVIAQAAALASTRRPTEA